MKAKKIIVLASILFAITAVFFLSCDNPIALGKQLDIEGPLVEFINPAPRSAIPDKFDFHGTITDDSTISRFEIKVKLGVDDYPKQWRYSGKSWEYSEDYGKNWKTYNERAEWSGTNSVSWSITIDMTVNGILPQDGEYIFSVQAWDASNMTDDNSYKTIVLVFDRAPPSVEIINPFLYNRHSYNSETGAFTDVELQSLHVIADGDTSANGSRNPATINKFLTDEFTLQWQIEDNHDIWSIDLLFYNYNVEVDSVPQTDLPDTFIYRYYVNLPPPPLMPDPNNNIKPNGSIIVPALTNSAGNYSGGELKNPVSGKTTVKLVSICYDAAGNPNEEKTLGYFIYWPRAKEPWIIFTEGIEDPSVYTLMDKDELEEKAFMIYPGRNIKATAFQTDGVSKVTYSIYEYVIDAGGNYISASPISLSYLEGPGSTVEFTSASKTQVVVRNQPRFNGLISSIFPWEFLPPNKSDNYVIAAVPYYSDGTPAGEEFKALFRVQDITFPMFEPINPIASNPIFMNIKNGKFTISGEVTDATKINSICMVWINPGNSGGGYAAMSQLSYFKNKDYEGWKNALALGVGNKGTEGIVDPVYPNRIWNIEPIWERVDLDTYRQVYSYSMEIDLASELGISISDHNLRSQMFLLRAENPDEKCAIETYAPQGDMLAPVILISEVKVTRAAGDEIICTPGQYALIEQFKANDKVTITGTWEEDSIKYLAFEDYLKNNFEIKLNGVLLTHNTGGVTITYTPSSGTSPTAKGGYVVVATVNDGNTLNLNNMRDTLMVSAKVMDFGGNPSEATASWLIQGDKLRFMRISSEASDETYSANSKPIDIFLEFSKPVILNPNRNSEPALLLNIYDENGQSITAQAVYKSGQTVENTRQYFTYTVVSNHNTQAGTYLNVTGLSGNDTGYNNLNIDSTNNYRFRWIYTNEEGGREEVRITSSTSLELLNTNTTVLTAHAIPTSGSYSLSAGKNISIDTKPPTVSSISASPIGWHGVDKELTITATFSENVSIKEIDGVPQLPRLNLNLGGSQQTTSVPADVSVNNNKITFKYKVVQNDNTTGAAGLQVTGYSPGGSITDLAGNPFGAWGNAQTAAGAHIDTGKPAAPTVKIAATNTSGASAITNTVGGVSITGETSYSQIKWSPKLTSTSTSGASYSVNLGTLYNTTLYVHVTASGTDTNNTTTGNRDRAILEYSFNDGADWTQAPFSTTTGQITAPVNITLNGFYSITARQTDSAGNTSDWSEPITFTRDNVGRILTSITTTSPPGTYTYTGAGANDRRDTIPIKVNFRKSVSLESAPTLTLSAVNGSNAKVTINATGTYPANVTEITFNYAVGANDNTNGSDLVVDSLSMNGYIRDATGVDISSLCTLPSTINFGKSIKIQTGALEVDSVLGFQSAGSVTQGIQTDGSYNTALKIKFKRNIFKGTATAQAVIRQSATGYRIPAVVTETQYNNKYRNVSGFISNYTRGTNGVNSSGEVDTTPKYILNYGVDPATITPDNTSALPKLAWDIREAEKVTFEVSAQAVKILDSNKDELIIEFTGSNALQVPGAVYEVTIPAGFVQDELGNLSPAININIGANPPYTAAAIGGVAKPFIRIYKPQETIDINATVNADTPKFTPTFTMKADVKMDSRTPNTSIRYFEATGDYAASAINWYTSAGTNNYVLRNNDDSNTNAMPARPADAPTNPLTNPTGTAYSTPISIGSNTVEGYIWRVRARAFIDTNPSDDSDEIAYRTVLSYQVANMAAGDNTRQNVGNGMQIWIRGGDGIGTSSVPGFPLTWEDDWNNLGTKRAGIRLMKNGGTLNNSTWQWVTWEINVVTYFDIILGNTEASPTASTILQYGPRQWAYQAGGWTPYKDYYPMYPGKHRYLHAGQPTNFIGTGTVTFYYKTDTNTTSATGKGPLSFSNTWKNRPNFDD